MKKTLLLLFSFLWLSIAYSRQVPLAKSTKVTSDSLRADVNSASRSTCDGAQPVGATFSNPINAGLITMASPFSHTAFNGPCYTNDIGYASNDVYYKFAIDRDAEVTVSHCGSGFDTYVYLLNSAGTTIKVNDDYGPACPGSNNASLRKILSAGTYYVVSEGYGTAVGNINTQISINVSGPIVTADRTDITRGEWAALTIQNYDPVRFQYCWYLGNTYTPQGVITCEDMQAIGVNKQSDFVCYAQDRVTLEAMVSNVITIRMFPEKPRLTSHISTICPGESGIITQDNYDPGSYNYHWYKGHDYQTGQHLSNFNNQQSLTVYEAGDYICYAIDKDQTWKITVSDVVHVNVGSAPAAPVIVADRTEICYGEIAYLHATDNQPVRWYAYDRYIETGTVFRSTLTEPIRATRINGCGESGFSNTINITAYYTPSPPVVSCDAASFCNGSGTTLHAAGTNIRWYKDGSYYRDGNDIWITEGGNYYATTNNGCYTSNPSASLGISVISLPATPSIQASRSVNLCAGEIVTLTATGNGTKYHWYKYGPAGQGGEMIAEGGSITVGEGTAFYCYAGNDCGFNMSPATITVTTIPAPAAPVISAVNNRTVLCSGEQATLTTAGNNITWYRVYPSWQSLGGGNSISISEPGTYYAHSANECTMSAQSNYIEITTGVPANPQNVTGIATSPGCGGSSGSIQASASSPSGGTIYYHIQNVRGEQTDNVFSGLAPGSYYVVARVLSAAGCYSEFVGSWVTVNAAPTAPANPQNVTGIATSPGCGSSSGSIQVSASSPSGGTIYYHIQNVRGEQTANVFSDLAPGSYYVVARVLSAAGCYSGYVGSWVTINPSPPVPGQPLISRSGSLTFCEGSYVDLTAPVSSTYLWSNGATSRTIRVTTSGDYSVTVSNASGCVSAASIPVKVSVNPLPISQISPSGTIELCSGSSITLSAPEGYSYQWNTGATTRQISVTAVGSYKVMVTNASGCYKISSATTVVRKNVPPAPQISSNGQSLICRGQSITLTAGGGLVDWFFNGAYQSTGASINALNPGEYTARSNNDCGYSPASNTLILKQNPLAYKQSRFTETDDSAPIAVDTATVLAENRATIAGMIKSSCEEGADSWLEQLAPGLAGRSDSAALSQSLREKLIAVCIAGGDLDHPMGASTSPQPTAGGYSSFGQVIKDVLGLSAFTATLNPWLIGSPYPHQVKQQATERYISATDAALCQRLAELHSSHQQSSPGVSFYQYLKDAYQQAMFLSQEELQLLENSCTNCRYILAKDLKLPVFMEAGQAGCISAATFSQLKGQLQAAFNGNLPEEDARYPQILSNYFNHQLGFALSYERYKDFQDSLETRPGALLCNEPPFTTAELDPYLAVKDLFSTSVASALQQYDTYIAGQRSQFRSNYISTCSQARPQVNLRAAEQLYHYTLYYYDQADNLVRTVPPEGVHPLSDQQIGWVGEARTAKTPDCSYSGPVSAANTTTALQDLSGALAADSAMAAEFWLYNPGTANSQLLATTPDRKFMLQACFSEKLLNVELYSLQADAGHPETMRFVKSNKASADITALGGLRPWTHLVVQSAYFAGSPLQVYVDGTLLATVPDGPSGACGWQVSSGEPLIAMPENLEFLKHMRLYSRLMTANEIAANATDQCFMYTSSLQPSLAAWHRFNIPAPGSELLAGEGSTLEKKNVPVYPGHTLPTSYAYNSTGQVVKQKTPDGGTSRFWYDNLSRLVVSRNAKQQNDQQYSYTLYDQLGRITEVGQKSMNNPPLTEPVFLDSLALQNFTLSGYNGQIVQTLYDSIPAPGNGLDILDQQHLRKRVAASVYRETQGSPVSQASYYSYDQSGNVKTLWQQVYGLGRKRLDYEYDLVSGKVNFLSYQRGEADQFYYKYQYDAENRLREAWSGTLALLKPFGGSQLLNGKMDAAYSYYLHGPLARIELGDQTGKVQGLDYAYTLQGWLKGVNGQELDAAKEMGKDGSATSTIAKDVMGYSLGYYGDDYHPIGENTPAFALQYQRQGQDLTGHNLYNGNISNTTVAISKFRGGDPVGYTYKYDQLNRLTRMRQHQLTAGASAWNASSITDSLKEDISYDGNGNILSYLRNGNGYNKPLAMDQLSYHYDRDYEGRLLSNQLRQVKDAVGRDNYDRDIDSQGSENYFYDQIGNLIADRQERIGRIRWTVYGKIQMIEKLDDTVIEYTYDPSGNRVSKNVNGQMTWYIRDAQGNTLGVYDNDSCRINWREQQLYGSSRLGMWKPNVNLNAQSGSAVWDTVGNRFFELSNHLGNVLAVISDKRTLKEDGTYQADVVSAQDYYPFGMIQPGRSFSTDSYRYGFNGKENDNEVKGVTGSQQDYGMRIYDPRLGRFLSVDPLSQSFSALTPYQFASNSPILNIDLDGLESSSSQKKVVRDATGTTALLMATKKAVQQQVSKSYVDASGRLIEVAAERESGGAAVGLLGKAGGLFLGFMFSSIDAGKGSDRPMEKITTNPETLSDFDVQQIKDRISRSQATAQDLLYQKEVERRAGSSKNVAFAQKLKSDLAFREKSELFNSDGTLKRDVIGRSIPIINGSNLNSNLQKALVNEGGNVSDWNKMSYSTGGSSGIDVHFYYNKKLDKVFYDWDYKSKLGSTYYEPEKTSKPKE